MHMCDMTHAHPCIQAVIKELAPYSRGSRYPSAETPVSSSVCVWVCVCVCVNVDVVGKVCEIE